jgi:hypothetical protein
MNDGWASRRIRRHARMCNLDFGGIGIQEGFYTQ